MKKILAILLVVCTVFALVACGGSSAPAEPGKVSGEFSGKADGMGGEIKVTLTFTDGAITGCSAEGKKETEKIGVPAMESLTEAVKTSGSIGVDVVSGATKTSEGFLAAAANAVTAAGLNPADFQ